MSACIPDLNAAHYSHYTFLLDDAAFSAVIHASLQQQMYMYYSSFIIGCSSRCVNRGFPLLWQSRTCAKKGGRENIPAPPILFSPLTAIVYGRPGIMASPNSPKVSSQKDSPRNSPRSFRFLNLRRGKRDLLSELHHPYDSKVN